MKRRLLDIAAYTLGAIMLIAAIVFDNLVTVGWMLFWTQ